MVCPWTYHNYINPNRDNDDAVEEAQDLKPQRDQQQQAMPASLTNYYLICPLDKKLCRLVSFLSQHPSNKVIVFILTFACVKYYASVLSRIRPLCYGYEYVVLHGKLAQRRRERAMEVFWGDRCSSGPGNYDDAGDGRRPPPLRRERRQGGPSSAPTSRPAASTCLTSRGRSSSTPLSIRCRTCTGWEGRLRGESGQVTCVLDKEGGIVRRLPQAEEVAGEGTPGCGGMQAPFVLVVVDRRGGGGQREGRQDDV